MSAPVSFCAVDEPTSTRNARMIESVFIATKVEKADVSV
jgi:hypothetical protein